MSEADIAKLTKVGLLLLTQLPLAISLAILIWHNRNRNRK